METSYQTRLPAAMGLLTPEEVAQLLQISIRTVYAQARRLGGFYPAGIER